MTDPAGPSDAPPDSSHSESVAEDPLCTGCGYNLRGLAG